MLIATSEICVADVDIYFVFCFLSFCIMDVDVRFRKLCCGCRHPFRLFFCITYVDFCFRKLCCGCRHPFRNLFLFSVLRMSTPASENCVTDVDIHFVFLFLFFVLRMSTSASKNCVVDVDIHFFFFHITDVNICFIIFFDFLYYRCRHPLQKIVLRMSTSVWLFFFCFFG